jgi:hypothetical protein
MADYYVSLLGDDSTGDGSETSSWRTITYGVSYYQIFYIINILVERV